MSITVLEKHIDAVARALGGPQFYVDQASAENLLTSTDPSVHAALTTNLPSKAMLAVLIGRGVLRSLETVDPIGTTIHVDVPAEATQAELDLLLDRVVEAAYEMERGQWDALVHSHTGDCVANDHCCAPRPDGPPYPAPQEPS